VENEIFREENLEGYFAVDGIVSLQIGKHIYTDNISSREYVVM
jgi:hypothetical protein